LIGAPGVTPGAGAGDILDANRLAEAVFSEMYAGPVRPVNTARFVFLDPRAPGFFVH